MKFNKNFLTILTLVVALSPFAVSIKTEAGMLSCLNAGNALAPAASKAATDVAAKATPELTKEATKTLGQWVAQQAGNLKEFAVNAPAAVEALGVKGLNKLSFTIDPSTMYLFLRNNPKLLLVGVPTAALIGVATAWYASVWNAKQTALKSNINESITGNFNHFNSIVSDMKVGKNNFLTLDSNATILEQTKKILTLPFFRQDKKLYNALKSFYEKCNEVIKKANSGIKPEASTTAYQEAQKAAKLVQNTLNSYL